MQQPPTIFSRRLSCVYRCFFHNKLRIASQTYFSVRTEKYAKEALGGKDFSQSRPFPLKPPILLSPIQSLSRVIPAQVPTGQHGAYHQHTYCHLILTCTDRCMVGSFSLIGILITSMHLCRQTSMKPSVSLLGGGVHRGGRLCLKPSPMGHFLSYLSFGQAKER